MFQITILLAFFASRENDREKDPLFLEINLSVKILLFLAYKSHSKWHC